MSLEGAMESAVMNDAAPAWLEMLSFGSEYLKVL
jgi:hypothetical protein